MSITFIIATYNRESTLKRAIESIISQPGFSDCELIIVDDGSHDRTDQICKEYVRRENIYYIQLPHNRGVGFARNLGVTRATYSWISFIDSDNELSPNTITYFSNIINTKAHIPIHFFPVLAENQKPYSSVSLMMTRAPSPILYVTDYYKGEFHTLTSRYLLTLFPFIETVNGGEGIIWKKIVRHSQKLQYHSHYSLIYCTSSSGRLSDVLVSPTRIAYLHSLDLLTFWPVYLRYAPLRLGSAIVKIVLYLLYFFLTALLHYVWNLRPDTRKKNYLK